MASTVKGIYRNGHLELLQRPEGVEDGDVEVTVRNAAREEVAAAVEERRRRALRWLHEGGWNLGGAPYPTRDELHDRTR
jgi:hypothetical protein